jgi:hypothetical protein
MYVWKKFAAPIFELSTNLHTDRPSKLVMDRPYLQSATTTDEHHGGEFQEERKQVNGTTVG